jgi:hypothetical protein
MSPSRLRLGAWFCRGGSRPTPARGPLLWPSRRRGRLIGARVKPEGRIGRGRTRRHQDVARGQLLLLQGYFSRDVNAEGSEVLDEPVKLTLITLHFLALLRLISNCRWQADHRATSPKPHWRPPTQTPSPPPVSAATRDRRSVVLRTLEGG